MSDHRRGGNLSSHVDVKLNQTTRKAQNIFVSHTLMILAGNSSFLHEFLSQEIEPTVHKKIGTVS